MVVCSANGLIVFLCIVFTKIYPTDILDSHESQKKDLEPLHHEFNRYRYVTIRPRAVCIFL